ncbi:hypothetical protein [Tepidibacter hydrothermalis]|uniref:DUF1449 family protein n=1 Tax=Tepidibacter hydrothermalis TaxID=3036126 RepID=A0ABY8EBK3_9FIRM|nr:hypothetical protein [Tepidibacter hydrothermalis]WFD10301.1 hypothetical protein P4S50_18435 [Tepidibacter hydrothermalis]
MNKLIQFLKIYLKSCTLILPFGFVGQFTGDLITYYNYGYTPTNFPLYSNVIMGTLASSLIMSFLLYPIEKIIPIYDENIFRKKLNEGLTRNKFKNLSNKETLLIVKHNFIKKFIFGDELSISLYNDKAIFKGSRVNIIAICNNFKFKKEITSN